MNHLLPAVMFCLLAAQPAITAELTAFDPFLGMWAGSGTLWGKPAAIQLQWKRTPVGKFVSLDFEVSDPDSRKSLFAGHAMYPAGQGTWHDTNGAVYSITWKADGDNIVVEWGQPGVPIGKSVYSVRTGGEVEIADFVRNKAGSWREFAHYVA